MNQDDQLTDYAKELLARLEVNATLLDSGVIWIRENNTPESRVSVLPFKKKAA